MLPAIDVVVALVAVVEAFPLPLTGFAFWFSIAPISSSSVSSSAVAVFRLAGRTAALFPASVAAFVVVVVVVAGVAVLAFALAAAVLAAAAGRPLGREAFLGGD